MADAFLGGALQNYVSRQNERSSDMGCVLNGVSDPLVKVWGITSGDREERLPFTKIIGRMPLCNRPIFILAVPE